MSRSYRKTSIKDVARKAGVSTTTVSCFVNGREAVCGPQTAERIRQAIAELHYTPSSLTRGLRHGATRTIGVCLLSPHDPSLRFGSVFFDRLWRGVVAGADGSDYSLLHYSDSVRNGTRCDALLDGRADGVLLMSADVERAEVLSRAGLPAVLTNRAGPIPDGCGAVCSDENQTVALALDHLWDLGHRRIAYLAGPVRAASPPEFMPEPVDDVALYRLASYERQMKLWGVLDPALVAYADAWWDEKGRIASEIARLYALSDRPTALVCGSDLIALAALRAVQTQNWRVPAQLSVVGVDDLSEARSAPVPLTTVRVPIEDVGREAVSNLLRLMDGQPLIACRSVLPVCDLVVRASTARVPR